MKNCQELFSKGYAEVDSLEEWENSETYCYVSSIYNKLIKRDKTSPNFINVYERNGKLLIVDNVFYDRFPLLTPIASYVPETLDYDTDKWEKGSRLPFAVTLDKYGYFVSYQDSEFKDDHPDEMFHLGIDKRPGGRGQKIGYSLDYLIARSPDFEKFIHPRVNSILMKGYNNMIELAHDNFSLTRCTNFNPSYQKMVKGYRMDRHIDTNAGDAFTVTYISYQMDQAQRIEGREILFGKRSEKDLNRWIDDQNRSDILPDDDISSPEMFEDYAWIKPRHGLTLYVNSWNPIFYHGINKLESDSKVYTVINNFKW